jgi:hypothetical protein
VNAPLLLGIGLNAVFALVMAVSGEYSWLGAVCLGSVAISMVGAAMIAAGQKRSGAIAVIVGAITFVPLGLIAVVGARRVLDALTAQEFERRRAAVRTLHNT